MKWVPGSNRPVSRLALKSTNDLQLKRKRLYVQERYSSDTRPRRSQRYAAVLTSFLGCFFRAGDFFGIPALKT